MEDFDIEEAYNRLKNEYEQLKQAYAGYEMGFKKAYEDPELRPHLKKIGEKIGVIIDDPPHEKAYKKEIEELKKQLEEKEAKEKEEKAKQKQEEFIKLLAKYGVTTDAEYQDFQKFIQENGIIPSTQKGWEKMLQDYRRAKIAQPTYQRPTFKNKIGEDFAKNPEEALFKAHLEALGLKQ